MPASVAADLFPPDELLPALLETSLTGVVLYTPRYDEAGQQVVDFEFAYLNPAAQRMLKLPAQPTGTYLSQFPQSAENGGFAFHRDTFASGEPGFFEINYQAGGYDNYFRVAGRRVGAGLLVSFTDTADQPRTPVEEALRASQAREQAARAEAETQRAILHNVLMQAPALICRLEGPRHVFRLVNPLYQQLVGERPLLDRPIREALPELAGQPFFDLLDRVYRTGEPFYAREMLAQLDHANAGTGELGQRYYNFVYQALRERCGAVEGILIFAHDVTNQVRARRQTEYGRQQLEVLNEELAAANEELQVTNEEFLLNNAELLRAQQQLRHLNEELEAHVQERTAEAQAARAAAEAQRAELLRVFEQAPVAIAEFRGPDYVIELTNPAVLALWDRTAAQALHTPLFKLLPESAGQGFEELLTQVRTTGEPFVAHELQSTVIRRGQADTIYCNFVYHPLREADGQINSVIVVAAEVTDQVRARKRAEALQAEVLAAARRQVQERETFHQVFEQTPASIALLRGPEHRVEYHNEAYQRLFPGRQMRGRTIAEMQPDAAEQGFVALLDRVYQTGETFFGRELQLDIDQPDGVRQETYFNFTYQAYRENGRITGVSVFAYDVTEQVQVRAEADRQRRLLHQLFMEAPVPVVILDGPALVLELVNPAYQQIFPGRELLGKPLLAALPELVGTAIFAILTEVYRTGATYVAQEMPLRLARHAEGPLEELYFTFTYQARRNAQGAVDGIMVFAHEVTDQVRARRAVEESGQYFRQMTDSVPAMVWVTNPAGQCTFLNQQWYRFTGQAEAEALGTGWLRAVHPDDVAAAGVAFSDANARQAPFNVLYRLRRHDGVYRWAIDSALPRFAAGGEYEGLVGTVIDVHEQKLTEQALQRLTKKLRKAHDEAEALNAELRISNEQLVRTNVDLDNFIYTASHDLKAPITNIEGLLEALQTELPPASRVGEVDYVLDMMNGAVERFKRTIEHLTDVSRLQKEHAQPATQVALAPVIEDVRQDLAPLLTETGGRLDVQVQACPTFTFSEKNLRSVVYNLLSNALKYHHPARPPLVRVRCRVEGAYQVLSVQDNGLGLDLSRDQNQLFGMFQRLHTHVEGSGIGLYMVKKMVENAGGRIEVQSQLGVGSTFTVYFLS